MFAINLIILIASLAVLYVLQRTFVSFNKRVLTAIVLGGLVGIFVYYTSDSTTAKKTLDVYNIFGVGYVRFLQMVVYPIVSVAVLYAMTKIGDKQKIGKPIAIIILTLMITTAIASALAIVLTLGFDLNMNSLTLNMSSQTVASIENLTSRQESLLNKPFYNIFTDFISTNPFADLTGARPNSLASLVIFFMMLGVAYLGIMKKNPEIATKFKGGVEVLYTLIMRLVVLILRLTPYGIFALFFRITLTSSYEDIINLANFIGVSYLAIGVMFIIHLLIIASSGLSIITYIKKITSLLLFGFISRSSASAIPLNINTQTKSLGVSESIATTGASFGAIMGQNGCAGIYPAMLAVLLAPTVGIDPTSISFILTLILIVTVNSFGIAGVGGGATFAAIAVLSAFNMPLGLVALLVGIEPIIDMARTMLNINGSVVASLVSAKATGNLDKKMFDDMSNIKANDATEL